MADHSKPNQTQTSDFDELIAYNPGTRADHDSPMIEMQDTLNELNAWIGVVTSLTTSGNVQRTVAFVQHDLCYLCDQIALQSGALLSHKHLVRIDAAIAHLNAAGHPWIDDMLPASGLPATAFTHVSLAVCKRAERQLAGLLQLHTTVGVPGVRIVGNDLALVYLRKLQALLVIVAHIEAG